MNPSHPNTKKKSFAEVALSQSITYPVSSLSIIFVLSTLYFHLRKKRVKLAKFFLTLRSIKSGVLAIERYFCYSIPSNQ